MPAWGLGPAIKLNCVDLPKPEPSQELAFSNGEGDVADRANGSFSQLLGDFLGSLETNLQSLIKGTKLRRHVWPVEKALSRAGKPSGYFRLISTG